MNFKMNVCFPLEIYERISTFCNDQDLKPIRCVSREQKTTVDRILEQKAKAAFQAYRFSPWIWEKKVAKSISHEGFYAPDYFFAKMIDKKLQKAGDTSEWSKMHQSKIPKIWKQYLENIYAINSFGNRPYPSPNEISFCLSTENSTNAGDHLLRVLFLLQVTRRETAEIMLKNSIEKAIAGGATIVSYLSFMNTIVPNERLKYALQAFVVGDRRALDNYMNTEKIPFSKILREKKEVIDQFDDGSKCILYSEAITIARLEQQTLGLYADLLMRALCYERLQEYAKAISDLTESLDTKGLDSSGRKSALNTRARCYQKIGDERKAEIDRKRIEDEDFLSAKLEKLATSDSE